MTAVGEARLPVLDATRCVHASIETASCRACVDVCPRGAWHLDDAALEFDSTLCDGCGLCQPACPRQAVAMPLVEGFSLGYALGLSVARRPLAGANALLAACEQATGNKAETSELGYVPCLHAIGLVDLLRAYRAGERVWLLSRGDCAACPRGRGESLFTRVASVNVALRQRGRQVVVLREVSLPSWHALMNSEVVAESAASRARRGFFRALSQRPAAAILADNPLFEPEKKSPGEYLPDGDDALMPWVVCLDASRCVGCHACVRVCPQAAIQFDAAAPAYHLHHRACSGCGLCGDVCQQHAVSLQAWGEPTQRVFPLVEQRCPCCGVVFYTPSALANPPQHCWVCANAKQKRRLYQVMA